MNQPYISLVSDHQLCQLQCQKSAALSNTMSILSLWLFEGDYVIIAAINTVNDAKISI